MYKDEIANCYCAKAHRLEMIMTKYYNDKLAPFNITVCQYCLLIHIDAAETGSLSEIAKRANLDRSTLARTIKPLIQKGLAEDLRTNGARSSQMRLTKEGRAKIEEVRQAWLAAQHHIEEVMERDNLAVLDILLKQVEKL